VSGVFTFWPTDPATNALAGPATVPVDIDAGARQTFVIAFAPSRADSEQEVRLRFGCANTRTAPVLIGVNSVALTTSDLPVPDIVALAATRRNDGIVWVDGAGAFSVATINLGILASITATADTGEIDLPISIAICQTNASGLCQEPPVDATLGLTTVIDANATPTFAIFVTASGEVPFEPGKNRVFVRFRDSGDLLRGATSVAVRTQ
jgi:hypothetical protein